MQKLTDMLSPESNIRSHIASAENKIAVLRNRGLSDDADMFESSIRLAIQNKDQNIGAPLRALDDIYQANLKTAPKERGSEQPSNLAQSIVDIMQMSEARNIGLNPASIRDAASAIIANDNETMSRLYSEFASDYKARLEQQDKEKKTLQTLNDGSSVLIGETTGTRYTPSGLPISPDAINTNVFNMSLAEKTPDPILQNTMTVPSDTGVAFNRDVYQAAPIQSGQVMTPAQFQSLPEGMKATAIPVQGGYLVQSIERGGRPLVNIAGSAPAPPPGYRNVFDAQQNLIAQELIPGSPQAQELASLEESKKTEKEAGIESANVVVTELDRFIEATDKMSRFPLASPLRKQMANFGFEQQAEVENILTTIRANLQFDYIADLKAKSPTGSTGLGAVSNIEFDALGSTLGKLSQVGDPDVQKQRALHIRKKFLDMIHGDQKHRDKLLKEGKVTQQQYDAIQSLYGGPQAGKPVENQDRQDKIEYYRRRLQQQ